MNRIVLVLLLLTGACTQHVATGSQEPDANVEQGVTAQQIQQLEAEARALARAEGCTQPGQCRTAPVGDRPCGGPRDFVIYCATGTDTVALFNKLEELRRAEQAYNRAHDLVSTCELRLPPETQLVGTTCQVAGAAVPR